MIHYKKLFQTSTKTDNQSYHIKTFNEIGIREPFPLELTKKQHKQEIITTNDHLVYDEHRYKDGSFSFKYVPTNELMFRMIRAC